MHHAIPRLQFEGVEEAHFRELVYTPLEEAATTLRGRQLGAYVPAADIPTPFLKGNCAVLFRFVASPNYELLQFVERATAHRLHPVILEYHSDKFVSRNPIKHGLGKMGFSEKENARIEWHTVVDFNVADGKRFSDIATVWNEPFIHFHHRMLLSEVTHIGVENLFEASSWFSKHGRIPRLYYEWLFSLMLSNAILFETYLFNSSEAAFTREVIGPAFCAVMQKFGVKPLVTILDPPGQEGDAFWTLYPAHMKRHLGPPAQGKTHVE